MKLSDFKYNLPKTSIAKYPVSPRDKSKLLVLHKDTGEMEDKHFTDVIDYMEKVMFLSLMKQECFRQGCTEKKKRQMQRLKFSF